MMSGTMEAVQILCSPIQYYGGFKKEEGGHYLMSLKSNRLSRLFMHYGCKFSPFVLPIILVMDIVNHA